MGLLDRFRRARWQHPDAGVRLAALKDLGVDQHDVLLNLARTDTDAAVRKAALRRVDDVSVLVEAATGDGDESVRQEAEKRLADVVVDAHDEAAAESALAGVREAKHLAAIAREARVPAVRERALARIDDARLLASIARHAGEPATRAAAVARLSDPALLADLALKSEHKEVALSALERVSDAEMMRAIAARGRSKAAAKRARARLDADRPLPPAGPTPDQRQAAADALVKRAEALSQGPYAARLADEVATLREEWSEVAAHVEDGARDRFQAALDRVEEQWQRHDAETAEETRRANERARQIAEHVSLCEMMESAASEAAIEEARTAWDRLAPVEGEDVAALERRFDQAEKVARERLTSGVAVADHHTRAEAVVVQLEELARDAARDPRWGALRRNWTQLEGEGEVTADLRDRAGRAIAAREATVAQERQAREARATDNVVKLDALAGRVEELAANPQPPLRDVDRALRELKSALDQPGALPPAEKERVVARLKAARAALYPKAQELRETDEWKRWANASVREDLCRRLEVLAAVEDDREVSRQYGDILKAWGEAAEVPRTDAEALRQRFHAARDAVKGRVDAFRAAQKQELQKNLEKKKDLLVRAEALLEMRPLGKAAEQMRALQAEWKATGPVPRAESEALWQRFRSAGNKVFETQKQETDKRKQEWAANLAKKEALIARAEALSASSAWDSASAEMKKLQAEWKTVGPVRKTQSDAVWQRFRAAGDGFFTRYKNRGEAEKVARDEQRSALCSEIESLVGAESLPSEPPVDLADRLQSVTERWNRLPRARGAEPLGERFYAARDRLLGAYPQVFAGTDLDVNANQARLEKLCEKLEVLAASTSPAESEGASAGSPAEVLATRLREALAARTMGAGAEAEARARAAADEVEQARAAWRRIGPVAGEAGRALNDRFRKACDRVLSAAKAASR